MSDGRNTFDDVLEAVRVALHARRSELSARAAGIEAALADYVAAVEGEIARRFTVEHGLKQPKRPALAPDRAAAALLALVRQLPELAAVRPAPAPDDPSPDPPSEPEPAPVPAGAFARLLDAARRAPLVIVGGVARRERLLDWPDRLREHVEWIDTTRQGTHAIGNLEKRIRERRLSGLIVLEGVISHRHSDPLLAAARQVGLAHAYAGKGGRSSLNRALSVLEAALAGSPR